MPRNIKILDRMCVPAGEMIIEQGSTGTRAYIIESGKVEVFLNNAAGETVKITELGPGALIGELAIVNDGQRSANVRALEATTLVSVSAHDLHKAMKKSPSLQDRLTETMANRVHELLGLLNNMQDAEKPAAKKKPFILGKMISTLENLSARLKK